jgi:hypothetical protein
MKQQSYPLPQSSPNFVSFFPSLGSLRWISSKVSRSRNKIQHTQTLYGQCILSLLMCQQNCAPVQGQHHFYMFQMTAALTACLKCSSIKQGSLLFLLQCIGNRKWNTNNFKLLKTLPSVSRLSRQCGILDISQPHRPPRPITGIALFTGIGLLFCAVFIVCNVSFIVCVALCAVFCLSVMCYFV